MPPAEGLSPATNKNRATGPDGGPVVALDPVSPNLGLVRARAGVAIASATRCVAPVPEVE